jgi:opacity protein-like surface antigen
MEAQMLLFPARLVLALMAVALCIGAPAARAQAGPMRYWMPSWPIGFGGNDAVDPSASAYGNFPSFDIRDGGAFAATRYNFGNGWFVGNESRVAGLSGLSQAGAFSNIGTYSQGVQFGYNFQNSPLSIYGGVDTLKYNSGIGNPFSQFDSSFGNASGYSAHAGVEIRPTSNLSLSFGASFTQGNSDGGSIGLPGASPFGVNGRR